MSSTSIDLTWIIEHAGPWSLVLFRVLGLFLFGPMMTSSIIPMQLKIAISAMVAAAVFCCVPPEFREPQVIGMMDLAPMLITEFLIGACIGLLASLPFLAVEMAGHIMGYQMGFSLAQAFNPALDANLNAMGSMLFYMAVTVFMYLGGMEALFAALLGTFDRVPPGAFNPMAVPLDLFVNTLTAAFEVSIRIAGPVTGTAFTILLAMGFMMKTMPQINVMMSGFAVKIIAGTLIVLASIFVIDRVLAGFIADVVDLAVRWAGDLGIGGYGIMESPVIGPADSGGGVSVGR